MWRLLPVNAFFTAEGFSLISQAYSSFMLCINNHDVRPRFNLAAEEYLLKDFTDDIFMLWRNGPSIIVGKHQNTLSEINTDYVRENNIEVVRRLTGGGAVFHDLGNLNFTFISNSPRQHGTSGMDFRKYTRPILDILQNLGIDARFEGRNDLTINGKKFSGNAECVYKNRVLHHGTILFSAHLPDLSSALRADPMKFSDKAVKSVRSRVTNVSEHLSSPMEVEAFRDMVFGHILEMYADSRIYQFSVADIARIEKLREEKYDTWDWNFGQSPVYNFRKVVKTPGGTVEFDFQVEKGIIVSARIFGDFFSTRDVAEIEQLLAGTPHEAGALRTLFESLTVGEYFNNAGLDDLLPGML